MQVHLLLPCLLASTALSFTQPVQHRRSAIQSPLFLSANLVALDRLKSDLVQACITKEETSVRSSIKQLEEEAELMGVGQSSSLSGLLSGEWELLYSSDDVTRSSPFFWAFRKAFPANANEIFSITDGIPAPIKEEVGPAFQQIDFSPETLKGRFVSRVKVATLGGVATSIMTTRASIVGIQGVDGIRLKIETSKPEKSSILSALGPLGEVIGENSPAFPSGEALERVLPGSSEVVMRTSFCDEGMRISRDDEENHVFVWKRRDFASYDFL
jgi:hypothetical protein